MVNCNKGSAPGEAGQSATGDTLKVSLKAFNISIGMRGQTVCERGTWQASIHKTTKTCKGNRTAVAEQRRPSRKKEQTFPQQ